MIIAKIEGGLGNQMFQYAIGRVLSYKNDLALKMDLSRYDDQTGLAPRQYELFLFNIKEDFSTPEENERIKKSKFHKLFRKIIQRLPLEINCSGHIAEKSFGFDKRVLNLKDNVYLHGYWQSWKYFDNYSDIIRKDFTLKQKYLNEIDGNLLAQIENSNSVALHIRRGDYISNENVSKIHGVCDRSYYNQAIELIKNRITNPKFFIFSDDPNWCLKEFGDEFFVVFGYKDWQDFWLMSKCKNQIIANSSFSWWAAWLNNNLEKIVIAPKRWFLGGDINIDDMFPESWIKL